MLHNTACSRGFVNFIYIYLIFRAFDSRLVLALKCDLRDDPVVKERLKRYGLQTVQYEEGLAVARRIRASRYLGTIFALQHRTLPD